ncbi:MAG: SDR family oxidoreductase [Phycisphaerae bacterium]|nr:SDR family oxidoreductase [Phycisphaerae bacterium]
MNAHASVQNLFDLRGRGAIVTGGAGHLGRALAEALAEAGASVVVTSRDQRRADEAARCLPVVEAAHHAGLALDHLVPESIEQMVSDAERILGRIDVLVNNGHDVLAADWTTVTADEMNRQLANQTGYFLLSRLVRDHAVRQGRAASIILMASMYAQVASYPDVYEGIGPANPVAYQMLKAGIVQMARHLAVYWGKDGVRVNCLSPGPFPASGADARLVARLAERSPMGRIGGPAELKGAVLFLASDASSYVTGHNLVVDGGWTVW